MNWLLKTFEELSNLELYNILQLRSAVFVVEQNCVYQDMDGDDVQCHHLFAQNELGHILAYCRIVPPGLHYEQASIGRVISNPKYRGTGAGIALMNQAIAQTKQLYPNTGIKIGAQQYLTKFYQAFGFVQSSDMYLEDNIPHIKMELNK